MDPQQPNGGDVILEARQVSKAFEGIQALREVSFTLRAGEIHALMGENGAGKSTLMKMLAGLHKPDGGEIRLHGSATTLRSPHEALKRGIAMIHQELMPIPDLSVAENILLGHEPASRFLGWINREMLEREAERLLGLLGVRLNVNQKMRNLSVAQMQTVEIAKALGRNASILLMDEPTAAISEHEVESLFGVIRTLKSRGVAIVYITHKMDEVFRIADSITVLRDGGIVGTCAARELNEQKLIALMVGREIGAIFSKASHLTEDGMQPIRMNLVGDDVRSHKFSGNKVRDSLRRLLPLKDGESDSALSVLGLSRAGAFRDVSFELRQGEILGIAGLMGAGRTEMVSAIFGLAPADAGEIRIHGQEVKIRCPADAMQHGIGMVTEDRKGYGLVPALTVKHNITLASLRDCCRGPFIDHSKEATIAETSIGAFSIKTSGANQPVSQLSGGNQQKVVIARSLLANPSILILDEPTRGIDIGAKADIYALIARLGREGKSIILVSSELPEVLSLSDRVLVMRQGEISAELNPSQTSQEEILRHAMPV